MNLSATGLMALLQTHVVELRFKRRHRKPGFADQRRMLCTNDRDLLLSNDGKKVFHYIPPTEPRKYNPLAKNLVGVFDIFMQQYRMVNVSSCDVIAVIPTRPPDKWWEYFNNQVLKMSAAQKLLFMNN